MLFNVVVVDDEQPALEEMRLLLRESGRIGRIHIFSHSDSALQAIPGLRPDIVFLDIQMPVWNGFELAEKLLKMLPELRVVYVTAHTNLDMTVTQFGGVDCLLKPVKREKLLESLDRLSRGT